MKPVGLIIALLLAILPASLAAQTAIMAGGVRVTTHPQSLKALRQDQLVRQGWDNSCGAAALSTVLTYHHAEDYSEAVIAVSILRNTDPDRVRARGGFSLLDLKRFANAVGLEATGYADLSLDYLAEQVTPAILPVRIRNYDHFVVFRGRVGNRVLIGDPAFGNLTLTLDKFDQVWASKIGFFITKPGTEALLSPMSPTVADLTVPNLNYIGRLGESDGGLPVTREFAPLLPPRQPVSPPTVIPGLS